MIHSGSSNNEYAELFLNIVSNQGQLTPVQRQGFPEDMSHHRSDMTTQAPPPPQQGSGPLKEQPDGPRAGVQDSLGRDL